MDNRADIKIPYSTRMMAWSHHRTCDLRWLQGAFSAFVGLFDRVGLNTNVGKTVGMVCRLFQAAGTQS